jgi:hypothetical protein
MPFPGSKPALAPTGAPQTQAAPPAPPAAPTQSAPQPPAAPTPPAAARKFWVAINGQTMLKTDAECAQLPPATPAMTEDQSSGWSTIAALLGASAAPAPGARGAFTRPGTVAAAPAATAQGAGDVPRGLFAGVENAQVIRRGNYLNAGDYIARLCSAEFKKGRSKNQVIIEVEILTSSYDANDPQKNGCNQEGSRGTIFIQHNDSFTSNIKEIVLAVCGFDEQGKARDVTDMVTQEECDALISAAQPYAGALVYLEARQITTKGGNPFTRISWWPCPLNKDGTPDTDKLFREVR